MMPIAGLVKPNTYRDSVALMLVSTKLAEMPGVAQASAMMGTPANKEILAATDLLAPTLEHARPNDLCIAVDAADDDTLERALRNAESLLAGGAAPAGTVLGSTRRPRTLEGALRDRPDANLALISVPGEYAAFEARRALRAGLHVFLFSDNVPLDEEVQLKQLAREQGLLIMGPDCGTALIAGAPLGFANAVRPGKVGIVASSGTGLQEVSCLVHRLGEGVSHGLGTGSRDLWQEVGGTSFLTALDALAADEGTAVLTLIAKPGAPEIQELVYARLAEICKPAVVYFLGAVATPPTASDELVFAADLEDAARCAVALARGERPSAAGTSRAPVEKLARRLICGLGPRQKSVSGLFAGGTLAQEAAAAIRRNVRGDPPSAPQANPGEVLHLASHRVLDLGDDAYTRGRPHPLIDPRLRNEELVAQAASGTVALFLVDVILGYGTHAEPADALSGAVARARAAALEQDAQLRVLASITGTDDDPQGFGRQRRALEKAGVVVAESATEAGLVAGLVAGLLSSAA